MWPKQRTATLGTRKKSQFAQSAQWKVETG